MGKVLLRTSSTSVIVSSIYLLAGACREDTDMIVWKLKTKVWSFALSENLSNQKFLRTEIKMQNSKNT